MQISLPLQEFWVVWAFLAMNIVTPGPNVINTMATAMAGGRRAGIGSAAGVGVGIGMWCLFMALGMSALIALFPRLGGVLTLLAIGLLGLFAWRYLRGAWAGWRGARAGLPQRLKPDSFATAFGRSLLVNALNPKALTTWLAILTLFPLARAGAGDVALLCAGACALSFSIHSVYATVFSTPTAARFYLRAGWVISGLAGIFFAAFGLRLIDGLLSG